MCVYMVRVCVRANATAEYDDDDAAQGSDVERTSKTLLVGCVCGARACRVRFGLLSVTMGHSFV